MPDDTERKPRKRAKTPKDAAPPDSLPAAAAAAAAADSTAAAEEHAETGTEALAEAAAAASADADADADATPMAWHEGDDALRDMMALNFIEYASYVIKDRAIPDINDGLKPVQRRIMHTLWEHDDGRFHKVANIVGASMRYHPHGDASIYSALVVLANKDYFIDRQGNFGNIHTGDPASAARYIECRLSPLAREVMFNPEITEYIDSYDGRNREPVALPAKVPGLLMLGADGIAVGMSTTIFPHNFNELLTAQISILRDEPFHIYPDFLTGGSMDVGDYADGAGRIRLRARLETTNDKTLVIREIPAGTTTESLIASIEKAARAGKIKISSINDYTAEKVEVEIALPRGAYAEETVKLLYGYTDCEVSLTSNLIVIRDNRPVVMTVSDILRYNTAKLVEDLRRELEIELGKLNTRFFEKTLAQLFIENRVYKRIEKSTTLEAVHSEVRTGMEELLSDYFRKHRERFRILEYHGKTVDIPPPQKRGIAAEDIEKLLQIQIRRISLFDINRNQQEIDEVLALIGEGQDNLKHLKRFTIRFLENLIKKYGGQFPRRTQITDLAEVNVREVALRNLRIGHDRTGQFVGHGVKNSNKDQEPIACSEFDRLVLLRNDGGYKVVPVAEKIYVGPLKFVLLADREQVYSLIYRDKKTGAYYAKRCRIESYIMDKEYAALPDGCIIEALYTNYGVQVRCELTPRKRQQETFIDVDFEQIEIRAASARGFKITPYEIQSFTQTRRGSPSPQGADEPAPADGSAPGPAPDSGKATPAPATTAGKADKRLPPPAPRAKPAPEVPSKKSAEPATPAAPKPKPSLKRAAPLVPEPADDVAESAKEPAPPAAVRTKAKHPRKPAAPQRPETPLLPQLSKAMLRPVDDDEDETPPAKSKKPDATRKPAPPAPKTKKTVPGAKRTDKPSPAPANRKAGKPVPVAEKRTEAATPAARKSEDPARKPLRKLIDEDSPFFLE